MPNPYNAGRLGRASLSPDLVDCIVFWTKNAAPMLDKLEKIEKIGYKFYFLHSLTPYGKNIETNLPEKQSIIKNFIELGNRIGKNRVVWRYDPIIIDDFHNVNWHSEHFSNLCKKLENSTKRCIISFVDPYKSSKNNFRSMTNEEIIAIAENFSKTSEKHNIKLFTCAETADLSTYGINHSSCIDKNMIEEIIGCKITAKHDKNQREMCGCIESIDIGAYNTCTNGCKYCYATHNSKAGKIHDINAPMITGYPKGTEIVTDRTSGSQKIFQMEMGI